MIDREKALKTFNTYVSKYNTEDEKEIYEIINNKIKEINKIMPLYKSIRGLTITQEPFIKTTTGKIKRQENLKFLNK